MSGYTFDDGFQTKVVAMLLRDEPFLVRVDGLIKPEYFEDEARGYLADLALSHYSKYRQAPSQAVLFNELRERKAKKLLSDDLLASVKTILIDVYTKADLSNRDYTVEKVEKFAQKRAIEEAILESAEKLDKGAAPEDLRPILTTALDVGALDGIGEIDYAADLEQRTKQRALALTGATMPTGVTTGFAEIDKHLFHSGWGKSELSSIMGPPKGGKSIALANFAVNAAKAGHNVLFVTLEVSHEITALRIDSNLSGMRPREVKASPVAAANEIKKRLPGMGIFKVREYPTGTFRPADLRRLIKRYESQSIKFDLIVIDYADIMAPDQYHNEERERLRTIYMSLRAIAQEEKVGILTATQVNRTGSTRNTAKKEDVSEDFNKVRLVDLMLSINMTDDEKKDKLMRLYVVANRNEQEGFAFHCQTDYGSMRFITKVLKVE